MGKKLYVGNLPFSADDQALVDIFTQSGTVASAKVIVDRETGRSKGFGFVEMSTDAEAIKAVEQFNGADYDGRPMTVNEARPMEPRAPRTGFGGGAGRGSRPPGGGAGAGGAGGGAGRGGFRGGRF